MLIRLASVSCGLFYVLALNVAAHSATITSNNFSFGFGATVNTVNSNPGTWTTSETNAFNTPVTAGNANATAIAVDTDFTLTPTVLGRGFSSGGPRFSGRVLLNEVASDVSGWTNAFEVALAGAYTGSLPYNAVNVQTTVNLSAISIYALAYNGTADPNAFHFNETTVGNMATSPNATTLTTTTAISVAGNYTQLIWNPSELAINGVSATRTFNVSGFGGTEFYVIDGFEFVGNIEVSYELMPVPEPTSLGLMSLGLLGALVQRRRRAQR